MTRSFRPPTDWHAVAGSGTLQDDLDCDVFNLSAILEDVGESPQTVRRIRGRWFAGQLASAAAFPQILMVGVGIGVAPPQSIATPGALPCPIADASWDGWMFLDVLPYAINTAGNPYLSLTDVAPSEIDTRAMRRLEDNDLFLAVQADTTSGEPLDAVYAFHLRFLVSDSSMR